MIHRLVILALAAGVIAAAATPAAGQVEVIVGGGEVAILPADDDLVVIALDPLDDDDADSEDSGSGDPEDAGDASDGAGAGPALPPPPAPPPPAPSPPSLGPGAEPRRPPPLAARHLVGPGRMRPVLGRVVGSLRPTLRWRHHGRGVRIYNVQVFHRGKKVLSAFPAPRHYRIPPGRLLPGRQYVWRVWPYTAGRGYPARPLGVSWFVAPSRPPAAR